MAVTRENKDTGSKTRETLAQMARDYDQSPLAGRLDAFAVKNPHPDKFQLGWADPMKLEQKIADGAEVVTGKVGKETYGIPDRDVAADGTHCKRRDVILIRYPIGAWKAKQAHGPLQAYKMLGSEVERFNAQAENDREKDHAAGAPANRPLPGRRPERQNINDVLAQQGKPTLDRS